MTDAPRWPLFPPSKEARARALAAIQQELDVDDSPIPIGLTDAEKNAARRPGLPALEKQMDVKPGWKTTQFWVTLLMSLVVLPLLSYLGNQALSPLGPMFDALASLNPLLGLAVPLAKTALFAFIAWCVKKLAANYDDNRTAIYTQAAAAKA